MQLIAYRTGHAHAHALARLFYVDAERNIPSDFSTTSSRELHWIILSVGFLLMAADEAGSFHGRLIEPIRGLIGAHGFGIFFFAWVIPGIAVVIVSRTITEQYDSGWTAVPTCQTHDNIVSTESSSYDGGCTCRYLRYRMTSTPLFVNC